MHEREGYTNADELQADDQLSPRPPLEPEGIRRPMSGEEASSDGSDDDERIPRPAISE